jgi:hypothetical protein
VLEAELASIGAELTAAQQELSALTEAIDASSALSAAERSTAEGDDRVKPLVADMARLRQERDAAPAGSEAASTAATALAAVERQYGNLIDDIGRLNREARRKELTRRIAELQDRTSKAQRELRRLRGEPEPSPAAVATGSLRLVTLDGTVAPSTPEAPDSDGPTVVAPNQVDTVGSCRAILPADARRATRPGQLPQQVPSRSDPATRRQGHRGWDARWPHHPPAGDRLPRPRGGQVDPERDRAAR